MVRHYVRKSSRPFSFEEKLQCAVTEVIEKRGTIRAAADYFELARTTVSDYVTKVSASVSAGAVASTSVTADRATTTAGSFASTSVAVNRTITDVSAVTSTPVANPSTFASRRVVTPEEIRPYPQASQDRVRTAPRRTTDRTRILTSTQEKNSFEQDRPRSKAKDSAPRHKQTRRTRSNKENSESVADSTDEFDLDIDPLYRPTALPSPKRTRSGRVVKRVNRTDP
ncbi:Uncharacterized protein APZ42_030046 [Daphnia magna]|uniref:HTH psq-type domain-containing protein n=1 Tax=Daphnia magna TaxID=35525 RepID=A0A164P3S1_9CRUS|nr:Uncharacterized protein APZ42_030046 [Daphnia magna]